MPHDINLPITSTRTKKLDAIVAPNVSTSTVATSAVDEIKRASHYEADTFINQQRVQDHNQTSHTFPEFDDFFSTDSSNPQAVAVYPKLDVVCAITPARDKGEPVPDTSSPLPCASASDSRSFLTPAKTNPAPSAANTFPEFDAFFASSASAQDKGEPVQDTSSPLPCAINVSNRLLDNETHNISGAKRHTTEQEAFVDKRRRLSTHFRSNSHTNTSAGAYFNTFPFTASRQDHNGPASALFQAVTSFPATDAPT